MLKVSKEKVKVELQILSSVAPSCPFLCSAKSAFQTDELLVFVLPYASGGDLFFHIQCSEGLSERRTRLITMQIIIGLQHLHSHGIIHRDLKPENIFVSGEGRIQIGDFGLSKFLCPVEHASDSTNVESSPRPGCFVFSSKAKTKKQVEWGSTKSDCGTPAYRSPEMILGKSYGQECDYWALGCIVYECIIGKHPFLGRDVETLNRQILTEQPAFENPLPKRISCTARWFILELLNKDRSKRLGYGPQAASKILTHPFFPRKFDEKRWRFTWKQVKELKAPPSVFLSPSGNVLCPESGFFFPSNVTRLSIADHVGAPDTPIDFEGFERLPNEVFYNKLIHASTASIEKA